MVAFKKMLVELPDGAVLSESQRQPGAKSALVRDRHGNLVGHAVLHDIPDNEVDEDDWSSADDYEPATESETSSLVPVAIVGGVVLGALLVRAATRRTSRRESQGHQPASRGQSNVDLGALLVQALRFAWPHCVRASKFASRLLRVVLKFVGVILLKGMRFGGSLLVRAIEIARSRRRSRSQVERPRFLLRNEVRQAPEGPILVDVQNETGADAVRLLPAVEPTAMSCDEAHQRLIVALVTRAISDEQMRMLLSARIEDVRGSLGLPATDEIPSAELAQHLNALVEARPGLLVELGDLLQREPAMARRLQARRVDAS